MLVRSKPLPWLCVVSCCSGACATRISDRIASVREVGTIPPPPGTSGRDVGFSVSFEGHSVWIFGDTFFPEPAADGYHWRASTWSWTDDRDASDGLSGWQHGLAADGKPLALLPHTANEQAFDDAHNGTPCPAGSDCGARHTPWPQAIVADSARHRLLLFYLAEETEPTSPFAFHSTGTSIAVWNDLSQPAVRPEVQPGGAVPTQLFDQDEPAWGAAVLIDRDTLVAYACAGGHPASPCSVARAPLDSALHRSAWRFWNGHAWVSDWREAVPVFDGAPLMSVHFNSYFKQYLAVFMVPLTSRMAFRLADHPEGPWSEAESLGNAEPPADKAAWDYSLSAHPELAQASGRVEYLTYFQPGNFLNGTLHLLRVEFRYAARAE